MVLHPQHLQRTRLLIKYGFTTPVFHEKFQKMSKKEIEKAIDDISNHKELLDYADEELAEEHNGSYSPTGYPFAKKRVKLVWESSSVNMEENYFWVLNHMTEDLSYSKVDKITDIFAASEGSAFFGASGQKLAAQQDRAAQYLRGVGEMIKQLFQIVRELRMIGERLVPYEFTEKKEGKKISKSADATLKSIFIDLVEGGSKNPSSVYGLASQVGFIALPDLFFNVIVHDEKDVDEKVNELKGYNAQVKTKLRQKLFAYINWKKQTHSELTNRRKFQLKYLRQHWAVIKMYMAWIKPYLKNIKRLTMNEDFLDSPELIGAFETSMTEIEILSSKDKKDGYHPVLLATFRYRTRPQMQARVEYQQGPHHTGRWELELRAYAWTEKRIEDYKNMKEREDIELLGMLDTHLADIMDSFAGDLEEFLKEAGEEIEMEEEEEPKKKKQTGLKALKEVASPFTSIFGGLNELFGSVVPINIGDLFKSDSKGSGNPKKAAGTSGGDLQTIFKNFRKARGMITP